MVHYIYIYFTGLNFGVTSYSEIFVSDRIFCRISWLGIAVGNWSGNKNEKLIHKQRVKNILCSY